MGRDKSAYWSARRTRAAMLARGAAQPRSFTPRVYAFDARVQIAGATGPACVEQIPEPLKSCPEATTRVIVRWQGKLEKGSIVHTGERELEVLRFFPMNARVRVAHLLCRAPEGV